MRPLGVVLIAEHFRTLIRRVALAFIESTIISQYELSEGERWTIDLQEARVIVPTQLNQPIERLIHFKSRRRAARPIFDLRRRPLVSGIIPRYKGSRSHFASHHPTKGEEKA